MLGKAYDEALVSYTEEDFLACFSLQNNVDLDLVIQDHTKFGKAIIKKAKVSPDAFIQISLQLAYYRHTGSWVEVILKLCLEIATILRRHIAPAGFPWSLVGSSP